jgi:thiol-disulfide isomerase/thioredoxin
MRELSITEQINSSVLTGKPVFVMVTATNCPSCDRAKPVFEASEQVFAASADFYSVNIESLDPAWVRGRQLRSAPTLLMYRFGIEENRLSTDEAFQRQGLEIGQFIDDYVTENEGGASTEFQCEACE